MFAMIWLCLSRQRIQVLAKAAKAVFCLLFTGLSHCHDRQQLHYFVITPVTLLRAQVMDIKPTMTASPISASIPGKNEVVTIADLLLNCGACSSVANCIQGTCLQPGKMARSGNISATSLQHSKQLMSTATDH